MKRAQIQVRWKEGLHMRPAARLVKKALSLQSSIFLKVNEHVADARSILSILVLCATFGTVVNIEVSGADEEMALQAITEIFESEEAGEATIFTEEDPGEAPSTGELANHHPGSAV